MEQKYIAALEIGSSHIRLAVGTVDASGVLTVLAVEEEKAVNIVRYGLIQNVDDVSNRINELIKKVENYASVSPRKIKSVYVAVGGRSMAATSRTYERHYNDEVEITSKIIDQINSEARQAIVADRQVIDVEPREFMIDNRACDNPVGSFAADLSVELNLIIAKPQMRRYIDRAVQERQNLHINGCFVRQLAEADLVLSADEKALGCIFVDFGAETTSVSIYKGGSMRYFATLPLGSRSITRDLTSMPCTEEQAELHKKEHGSAMPSEPASRRSNNMEGVDTATINNYVRARAEEIVLNILEQVKYAHYSIRTDLPAGIILVGGGSKLDGFLNLLAAQSGIKVRYGTVPSIIRISDSKVQPNDMIDVISLLYVAAANPVECTERIEPPVPQPPQPDPEDYEDDDEEEGPHPRGSRRTTMKAPKGPSIFSRFKDKLTGVIFPDEEDDDDDDEI